MTCSVIITTYQRPTFLLRAVESVLAQTIRTEIIVVDDNGLGTTAQIETQKVLQEFLHTIVYLPLKKNSGACTARNQGVAVATGEYIFFLDDDDIFLPKKVEAQSRFLDSHPKYDGCLSAFKRLHENGNEIIADSNFPKVGSYKDFVLKGNFFTPMLAIRRTSFLEINGFKEIPRFQDRFFLLHCLKSGMQFHEIHEQLYVMYEHAGERVTHNSVAKSIEALEILKVFIDHHQQELTNAEYQAFLQKDIRMRATVYYIAENYGTRLKAIPYYYSAFLRSFELKDIVSILKTVLKTS